MPVLTSSKISSVPWRDVISRTASRYPGRGRQMPMFSITGSTMKQATSPDASTRSRASASLYGMTIVSASVAFVMPAVPGTENGASAGPAWSSGGFIEIITSSWWPW